MLKRDRLMKLKWLLAAGLLLSLGVIFGCSLVSSGRTGNLLGEQNPEQVTNIVAMPAPSQTTVSQAALTPVGSIPKPTIERSMASSLPEPTPTAVPVLLPLTQGGCCVQPFWAPDSQRVLFLDKPIASLPAGLWGVGLEGGVPELVSERLGIFSSTLNYRAFLENGVTLVERLADRQQWQIANGGRLVYFSVDDEHLAWMIPSSSSGLREVWVSQVDGSQAQRVYASAGASFVAWLADGRILIQELAQDGSGDQDLSVISLPEDPGELGQSKPLAQGFRLRSPLASPDGGWIAYYVTFDEDSGANGLWLASTRTGEKKKLSLFGAYRWRNASQLLVIPLDLEQPEHRIWQVDAETGVAIPLTDPSLTPFKVGGGDWQVSPDGQWMIFVSARDNNIWLMKLP